MDISPWTLIGAALGWLVGLIIVRLITRKDRTAMKKNRKKHDPLNYYSNRAESDAVEAERLSKALGSIIDVSIPLHINVPSFSAYGGHRGGAKAYRAGTVGSAGYGASGSANTGTGARMSMDEFSGVADLMIEPALEEVGFAVGVVRGVRSFDVDKIGRLTGVTYKQVWKPGENEAVCRRSQSDDLWSMLNASLSFSFDTRTGRAKPPASKPVVVDYEKPHAMHDCKHGFYAYYDGSDDYHNENRVSAVVEGYGETVIGSRGFRSMKARIVALHIPETIKPHVGRMIARNYPDVRILEAFDQMVTEFPPDSQGNEITPDSDPNFWTRPA